MSGHIECRVHIEAPPEVVWEVANSMENDRRHSRGANSVLRSDPERHAVVLHVVTPPDQAGRVWVYDVERIMDADRRMTYARRSNNDHFRYSFAVWTYEPDGSGTELRCVQDFEMSDTSPVRDDEMAEIIESGTLTAMRRTAEFVEEMVGRRTE